MLGQRIFALLLLIVPALVAMIGWNMMKNGVYDYMAEEPFPILSFIFGLVLFLGGVGFIAGFIFHRDKKRRLLQPRFLKKKKKN